MKDKLIFQFGWIYKVLTVLFVALKLEGIVTWSWLWVVSPIFIQGGILLICYLFLFVVWVFNELK